MCFYIFWPDYNLWSIWCFTLFEHIFFFIFYLWKFGSIFEFRSTLFFLWTRQHFSREAQRIIISFDFSFFVQMFETFRKSSNRKTCLGSIAAIVCICIIAKSFLLSKKCSDETVESKISLHNSSTIACFLFCISRNFESIEVPKRDYECMFPFSPNK